MRLFDFRKYPIWKALEQHREDTSVYGMAIKQRGKIPRQYIADLPEQFLLENTHADREEKMCRSHVSHYTVGSAEPSVRTRRQIAGEGP